MKKKTNKQLRDNLKKNSSEIQHDYKKKEELANLSKELFLKTVFSDEIDLIHHRVSNKNINGMRWSNKAIQKSLKCRFTITAYVIKKN